MGPLFWLPTRGRGSQVSGSTSPYDPDASDYFSRIASNGGTISAPDKSAFNTFIVTLKTGGQWAKLIELGRFGGDQLAAALVKVKDPGTGNLVNHNFVSADYDPVSGLTGDGSTKYLETGTTPSSFGASFSDLSLGAFVLGDSANGTNTSFSNIAVGGVGSYIPFGGGGGVGAISNDGVSNVIICEGLHVITRSSSTINYYWQGDTYNVTQSATASGDTGPVTIFSYSGGFFFNKTVQGYFIGTALTSSDSVAINDAFIALTGNLDLSRNTGILVCFGDSITAGTGASDAAHSYPYVLAGLEGMTLSVHGNGGTRLFGGVATGAILESNAGSGRGSVLSRICAQKPRKVVIVYGTNDVDAADAADSPATFQTAFESVLNTVKSGTGLSWNDIYVAGVTIRDPALNPNSTLQRQIDYTAASQAAAQSFGCKFLNLNTYMLNNGGYSLLLDGTHPNDTGCTLIANAIFNGVPQITQVDFTGLTGASFITGGAGKGYLQYIGLVPQGIWFNTGTETQPDYSSLGVGNYVQIPINPLAGQDDLPEQMKNGINVSGTGEWTANHSSGSNQCVITDIVNQLDTPAADVNTGAAITVLQTGAPPL